MRNLKNNIKKIFTVSLSFVILFTICILPVSAQTAPSNFTVKRTKVMESYIGDNNGFTAFATTDGTIVYCMDLAKKGATTGTKYTLSKEASVGLKYIIQNGYPNKKITNRDEIDQYITQSAVWWYLDDVEKAGNLSKAFQTTDKEAYSGIRNQIKNLVQGAKNAKESTKPSMNVSVNNKTLKLTSDKKYYESDYITVTLVEANSYNVTLSNSSATAIDASGNIKTTFNAGDKFKVRISANDVTKQTSLNIKITATGNDSYVAIFNPGDSSYQRVVSTKIYSKDVNLAKTLSFSVTPDKKNCSINNGKYYGKNGNEVDKKTYNKECGKACTVENDKYYGKDGNEVDKNTYNEECGKVCKTENGKYYGKNGNEVDEKTYNKECASSVITVPNTLSNQSITALVMGIIFIVSGLGLITYRYKMSKN